MDNYSHYNACCISNFRNAKNEIKKMSNKSIKARDETRNHARNEL